MHILHGNVIFDLEFDIVLWMVVLYDNASQFPDSRLSAPTQSWLNSISKDDDSFDNDNNDAGNDETATLKNNDKDDDCDDDNDDEDGDEGGLCDANV